MTFWSHTSFLFILSTSLSTSNYHFLSYCSRVHKFLNQNSHLSHQCILIMHLLNDLFVTSVSRLNKTEALINSHQVWPRYDSDMTQHSFSSPTSFSFTNTLFIYITFFPCHKHISFRPSAASEHYINRSFCINLLLYS